MYSAVQIFKKEGELIVGEEEEKEEKKRRRNTPTRTIDKNNKIAETS